ncbi:transposase [Candidatus Bathyarchaeota archaeon]|nr:transposase [Candidatus Bathyarchaeota archaeon]
MYLDRVRELFENVDWAPFEAEVNTLYNMEGRGRRPKPPLAYLKAILVKMLLEINSFTKLVKRLRNNPDLASLCGFDEPPSRMGFSRFMKRLSEAELDQRLFQEALRQLREAEPKRRGRPKKGR